MKPQQSQRTVAYPRSFVEYVPLDAGLGSIAAGVVIGRLAMSLCYELVDI
jgi:hypothetical protein